MLGMEDLFHDLRTSLRSLLRQPMLTVVAVATLGIGLGASSAVFTLTDAVLLQPLPYADPERLVQLWETPEAGAHNPISAGVLADWRTHSRSFEGITIFNSVELNLTGDGEPERLTGLRISADGLRLLGARPALGRVFSPGEDQSGSGKVVVLTHALWHRRFGGAHEVLGRSIRLGNEPHTIVGVLPPGFLHWDTPQLVVPFDVSTADARVRSNQWLRVVGRLKPGVSAEHASAELQAIADRFRPFYPAFKKNWGAIAVPLHTQITGDIRPSLRILMGAGALVLVIACANVANLLLARASTRGKEVSIRAALGASRWRLVRQWLADGVWLSTAGGALGLVLAMGGLRALTTMGMETLPRRFEPALDAHVVLFALVACLITAVVCGLVPALASHRPQPADALRERGAGSRSGAGIRRGLVVSQIALAMVLLVGAGLLVNSLWRLQLVSPGFVAERALTLQLSLSPSRYPDAAHREPFFDRLLERIGVLPGVEMAALSGAMPLAYGPRDNMFTIGAHTVLEDRYAEFDFCTPGYFRAMGIPVRHGRVFDHRDIAARAPVVVVNETFVREYFRDEDPIGKRVSVGAEGWDIVGVVGDVRSRDLANRIRPAVYRLSSSAGVVSNWHLVLRTTGEPAALADGVRRAIHAIDPEQPVARVRTLEGVVAASTTSRRLTLVLLATFAAASLLLACIGLYGVMAYDVTRRTQEIGIRMALGASRGDVLALVLRHGLTLTVVGLAMGTSGALALGRVLRGLLYEVSASDPATIAATGAVLLLVAVLASWVPARRAAGIAPTEALRND
jgi:predicted permease